MTYNPQSAYHITSLNQELAELEPQVDAAWRAYQAALEDMDHWRSAHAPIRARMQWQLCLDLRDHWDRLENQIAELEHRRYLALTQQAALYA